MLTLREKLIRRFKCFEVFISDLEINQIRFQCLNKTILQRGAIASIHHFFSKNKNTQSENQ